MKTETKALHLREISGVNCREVSDWHGVPLNGLYFVEMTPVKPSPGSAGNPPVILMPGGWDGTLGAFSEDLFRRLLTEEEAPAVFEGHFRYDGKAGYCEPGEIVRDLVTIFQEQAAPPVVAAICGSCPIVMEGILEAQETLSESSLSGVVMFGATTPDFLNRQGRMLIAGITNRKTQIIARYLIRSGHPYTPGNVERILEWYDGTRLREAMNSGEVDGKFDTEFPIPVEMMFWRSDIVSRAGAARIRRVFNIPFEKAKIPGRHGSLRKTPVADDAIVAFYRKTGLNIGQSSGASAVPQPVG